MPLTSQTAIVKAADVVPQQTGRARVPRRARFVVSCPAAWMLARGSCPRDVCTIVINYCGIKRVVRKLSFGVGTCGGCIVSGRLSGMCRDVPETSDVQLPTALLPPLGLRTP